MFRVLGKAGHRGRSCAEARLAPDPRPIDDCRSVLGRIDVHSKGSLAEGRVDDLYDGIRNRGNIGIGRHDGCEALEHLVGEARIGPASYSAARAWSAGEPACAK
jgi:hypothetical protein